MFFVKSKHIFEDSISLVAFAPEEPFHSSWNYWLKYLDFGMNTPQKLETILVL